MPHTLNIFLQGFEKGSFYISNPTHCENREVGGISPPWLKSFKNGGEITPRGDITPLSFLSNLRRGGYHHLCRKLCKMGGISHLGGISPPCPYMASVNGCTGPLPAPEPPLTDSPQISFPLPIPSWDVAFHQLYCGSQRGHCTVQDYTAQSATSSNQHLVEDSNIVRGTKYSNVLSF